MNKNMNNMNTKVGQFSDLMPDEIKMIFKDSPRDHIDWALVMYLFRHSKFPYGYGLIFDEKNVITIGKISKWFDLDYDDVYRRLNRMKLWVSVGTVYGYYRPFNVCYITKIGIDTIMGTMENLC